MKTLKYLLPLTALAAGLALAGCDRTVTKSKSTTENADGSAKTKETTVTQKSDGTTVKTQETKTTPPKP